MAKYFVKNVSGQSTKNPVTPFEILSWVVAEQLSEGWLVWKEGGKAWQDPANVSELKWIFFFENLFDGLEKLVEELEGKQQAQQAENAELRKTVTDLDRQVQIMAAEKIGASEVHQMIQRELEDRIKIVDAEEDRKKRVEEIKSTILQDFAADLNKLPSEARSKLVRRAKGLGYKVVDDKMSVASAENEFTKEVEAELGKSVSTEKPETAFEIEDPEDKLPVGGDRVVAWLMEHDPNLSNKEAVAKTLEAFKAIGAEDVQLAIQWLDDQIGEPASVPESPEELSSFDNPERIAETIAQALGYDTLKNAKKKKAIKAIAGEFASREASERTEETLVKVISAAVESGQLRRKE